MEVEFDKEIDAILRKARPSRGVPVGDDPTEPKKHLDADTIAAFAENALPNKAKLLNAEHFAECDRCRKQLSFVMQMNSEAEVVAAAPAVEPVIETSIPWYRSFFKAPSLALATGALVLAFGGILGYMALQQQQLDRGAVVTEVIQSNQARVGPNFNEHADPNTAPLEALIATANPTPPLANMAANAAASAPGEAAGTSGRTDSDTSKSGVASVNREGSFQADGAAASENSFIIDGQEVTNAKPAAKSAAAPPPPPSVADSVSSGVTLQSDENKQDEPAELKKESKDLELAKQRTASKLGPSRSLGPVQNQSNQMNSSLPVTRNVGGKTFNNRDGAWYDSAYHGQATANYRRGTVEYKKLDSGLRNVADKVGGTVVILWKSKVYRIQ